MPQSALRGQADDLHPTTELDARDQEPIDVQVGTLGETNGVEEAFFLANHHEGCRILKCIDPEKHREWRRRRRSVDVQETVCNPQPNKELGRIDN